MSFSGFSFIFAFLPLVFAAYFLIPSRFRTARNAVLLGFGILFYACCGLRALPLLLLSVCLSYACGLAAAPGGKHPHAAVCGVTAHLALLAAFKYLSPLAGALNVALPAIVLPLGISFYTFRGISYILDVKRGDTPPERNFLSLALYIAFLPQLLSGPIARYSSMSADIIDRRETLSDAAEGMTRFCFGLAKKLLIADALGPLADAVFAAPGLTLSLAWIGAIAYTLQIYFDFSGYSDMAIGLARVFGFSTAENFNYPYTARSVTDFWRRWHISLSSWFRDYLYIPLGGNRCGGARQLLNLFIVWGLTGLWHGAATNFLLWGLYYALLLACERFVRRNAQGKLPSPLQHLYALLAVVVGWVFFRADSASAAFDFIGAMFGGAPLWDPRTTYFLLEYWHVLLLGVIASLPLGQWLRARLAAKDAKLLLALGPRVLALALAGICYVALVGSSYNAFIYFNF
ncbi:MAG: MBOAT family O-acyltransferase [Oscillospiraceae bacterium]